MVGQFETWLDIAEMGERSGADAWVSGLVAAGIGMASGGLALCLVVAVRRLRQRLSDLERRHAEHVERMRGPSVREYCRSLIAALSLRVPRTQRPRGTSEAESDLIESMRLQARSYRNMTRKLSEAAAEPMNEGACGSLHLREVEQPLGSDRPTPNKDRTMNEEESVDAILAEAGQAALTEADDAAQPIERAVDAEAEHQQAAEEVFASMPEAELADDAMADEASADETPVEVGEQPSDDTNEADDDIDDPPANADEQPSAEEDAEANTEPSDDAHEAAEDIGDPPACAECETPEADDRNADARLAALEASVEQLLATPGNGESSRPDASALQELCVQAESLGRVLSELTERLATERASAEQILTRVDQRIEALQAASQAGEAAASLSDVTADTPADASLIDDVPAADTAPLPTPARALNGNAGCSSPAGELQALDASLIEHLAQRKQVLNQIDGAFRDRQMKLAAEILQAETGQVELGDALEKIEAAVSTIQALAHEAAPTLENAV